MAIIIERHEPPTPALPWYLDMEMDCGHCRSRFRLEASDLDSDERGLDAPWRVVTERSPRGASRAEGDCPACGHRVIVHRIHPLT